MKYPSNKPSVAAATRHKSKHSSPAMRKPSKSDTTPSPKTLDGTEQKDLFEKAMAAFHKRQFPTARELFEKAATGPVAEMAHAASTHARMCERRVAQEGPELRTAEDYYTYGVSLLNRGDLAGAAAALQKAADSARDADHIHYALALCLGLRGETSAAARHLRRAIEISPSNRTAARNDPEFQSLVRHAEIREALGG
jgi:tetratricopeptide (TPR) repeat protein